VPPFHARHAYGCDGRFLACIDVGSATRDWKGGRYGSGQLVLLADQDLLLLTKEEGELVLVSADTGAAHRAGARPRHRR
jgi:outer membrane protein assembly factor BamB